MTLVCKLRLAAVKAGGTLEEDEGRRDMRVFQAVAPSGHVWAGNDCVHVRIDWASGSGPRVAEFNASAFDSALQTISHGLRLMTPEETELCADE